MNERLLNPVSDAELERRWVAVRKAMAGHGVDAIVVQNNNYRLGGHCKGLTDHPATNGYPKTIIFHADDFMTVIDMGPRGGVRKLGGNDEVHRSATVETRTAIGQLMIANLTAHFAGQKLPTPVMLR